MNRPIPFLMLLALLLVVPARAEEEPAPPKSEKPDRPEKPEKPAPDADDDKDAGDGDADKGRKAKANPNRAPLFELTGIDKNTYALEDFRGKWVVLEWTNPGCPFVQRHYRIGHMQAMQKKYRDKGVVWLTICSTNPNHRDYMTVEQWQAHAKKRGHVPTALLMDADGEVGRLYEARTTPQICVIDPKGVRVYDGAFDDAPRARSKEDIKAAKNYVDWVLGKVLKGEKSPVRRTKPYGCSVKYPKRKSAKQ